MRRSSLVMSLPQLRLLFCRTGMVRIDQLDTLHGSSMTLPSSLACPVVESVGYTDGDDSPTNLQNMKATALAWCLDGRRFLQIRSGSDLIRDICRRIVKGLGHRNFILSSISDWNVILHSSLLSLTAPVFPLGYLHKYTAPPGPRVQERPEGLICPKGVENYYVTIGAWLRRQSKHSNL